MNNPGVNCNVSECKHYVSGDSCKLNMISVTHETTNEMAVDTPHFCKNFSQK